MKIQLASDLHLEFLIQLFPGERRVSPAPDAEVLVLAGDVCNGADVIELFGKWPVPVLYVAGNHEGYGHCWYAVVEELKRASRGTAVQFLERKAVEIDGIRFLGCTLWTDYRLRERTTQQHAMQHAERSLNDHRRIRNRDGSAFSAHDALREHERARAWLAAELATPFDGKTVVITHHAPHPLSAHPRYDSDVLTTAFVSDLSALMPGVDVWFHGHKHDGHDYRVGDCRVVANPAGYMLNRSSARSVAELMFENPKFRIECLVDTET